jgi:hypothetical protein
MAVMKKRRRQIKAQADSFELRVKRDINLEPDCFAIKIPESVKGVFGKGKPILAKTECDFAAFIAGQMAVFDCKERDKEKFYINEVCLSKKSCHQYFFLKDAYEKGMQSNSYVHSGYLCHFKPLNLIAWISIGKILDHLISRKQIISIQDLPYHAYQPFNERIDFKKLLGLKEEYV